MYFPEASLSAFKIHPSVHLPVGEEEAMEVI
jgi:hypothetical protein